MRLDINSKFVIESDQYEFTVSEKSVIKSGENAGNILESAIGHFSNLNSAVKFLLDRTVKTSKAVNDLQQVLREVNEMKRDIDKALEPLEGNK